MVANGQTVLLAGLVSETQNGERAGVPVLDQIPIIGEAFTPTNTRNLMRTELIIFIRPQVIRDGVDASVVAEELRSKLRGDKIGIGAPAGRRDPISARAGAMSGTRLLRHAGLKTGLTGGELDIRLGGARDHGTGATSADRIRRLRRPGVLHRDSEPCCRAWHIGPFWRRTGGFDARDRGGGCPRVHYPRQADRRRYPARLGECGERGCWKHAGKHRGCRVAWTCSGPCIFRSAGNLLPAAPSPWNWPWRRQARRGRRCLARLDAHSGCDRNRGAHGADLLHSEPAFLRRPLCAAAKLPFGLFFAPAIWFCWLLNAIYFKI